VRDIDTVSALISEISRTSEDQANNLRQITEGVDRVAHITQSNSANADASASTATAVGRQAGELKGAIAEFKLRQGGQGTQGVTESDMMARFAAWMSSRAGNV
jgi:methyl-accepting chemotaxis protein